MENPHVDAVFGLHLWSPTHVGKVIVQAGPFFASAEHVSPHHSRAWRPWAMPHLNVDPLVAAAQIVVATQTLVSRETSPFHTAVVTFGESTAAAPATSSPTRCVSPAPSAPTTRATASTCRAASARWHAGIATSLRAEAEYEVGPGCQACVNDAAITELVRRAAEATVGAERIPAEDGRQSVSDDMALFLDAAPGCYFLVGAGNPERDITAPHHSPRFDIDEESLPIGVEVLAHAALEYLA